MDKIKSWWTSFHASFHDSEIILIARVKLFIGVTFTALQTSGVDVSSFFTDHPVAANVVKVFFAWLIVDGSVQEWARRNRATDLDAPPELKDDHLHTEKP